MNQNNETQIDQNDTNDTNASEPLDDVGLRRAPRHQIPAEPNASGLTPVEPALLQKLEECKARRLQVADRLLGLEQEKIALLRAAHEVDSVTQSIFVKINKDRKLPPNTITEIDPETGFLTILHDPTANQPS